MKPSLSQYRPLIQFRRLPQNRNSALVNGSSWNCYCTMVASPSIPLRRSVYPQAMYTLSAPAKSLSIASATPPVFAAPCLGTDQCRAPNVECSGAFRNISQRLRHRQFHKCYPRTLCDLFPANAGQNFPFPPVIGCWHDSVLVASFAHWQTAAPALLYCHAPFLYLRLVFQFAARHLDTPPISY